MLECVMDYETRSRLPLDKVGAIEYARHESTSIFCLGYQINDGPPRLWIPERAPMPEDLEEAFSSGILIAHNAPFEKAITRYTLPRYPLLTPGQRQMLKSIPTHRWRCIAAKAALSALPRSLEGVGKALNLPLQKDARGHKLIKKYSKPRKPSKHNPKPWWDDRKDLRGIYRYCITDVKVEVDAHQRLPDLPELEQRIWELDQKINERGVLIDIPTVKLVLQLVQEETRHIERRVRELSKGAVDGPQKVSQLLRWVNARGAKIANLQAPTITDRLLDEDLRPEVKAMLEHRQLGSKTSTAKYVTMLRAVGEDHRARELLLYSGAIPTARWAGKRIQPQNFPRPTLTQFNASEAIELIKRGGGLSALRKRYGENQVMKVLVSIMRGMIIASPGKELFCADWAAVEARIAFWVAEHEEGIQAFRENRKLYEEMASQAFGIPIEEIAKDSLERFVGKESILGCQYGLGWLKFMRNCHQKGMKQVTPDIAKKSVYTYRRVHHPVPEFWGKIEQACIEAILKPGKRIRVTKVVVYKKGEWLNIKLPSGRRLRYPFPRLAQKKLANGRLVPEIRYWGIDSYTRQWVEMSIWGGVFTNHIVQGIARDLMAHAMINIEAAGYEFLLSIHDESLSERRKGEGSLAEYIQLTTKLPIWAKGCPITAEGWVGDRYRK